MRLKFVPPMMPTLVAKPPQGDGWIHEIQLDGYRTEIVINGTDDVIRPKLQCAMCGGKKVGLILYSRYLPERLWQGQGRGDDRARYLRDC